MKESVEDCRRLVTDEPHLEVGTCLQCTGQKPGIGSFSESREVTVGGMAFLCVGENPVVRVPDIVFATTGIRVFCEDYT